MSMGLSHALGYTIQRVYSNKGVQLKYMKGKENLVGVIVLIAGLMPAILSCRPKPNPVAVTSTAPALTVSAVPTTNATIAVELTAQAPQTTAVPPTLIADITPTPLSCQLPEDWVEYRVQSGDTLFALGAFTETAVDDLKLANCLLSDFLEIDQVLFLPTLPPVREPLLPVAPEVAGAGVEFAESCLLDCPIDRSVGLVRPFGAPNQPSPCLADESHPYIERASEGVVFNGFRTYFFACNFVDPTTWDIHLEGPDGYKADLIVEPLLSLEWQKIVDGGEAQLVLAWYTTCEAPAGAYTLTLIANHDANNTAEWTGVVEPLGIETMLVAPEIGSPTTKFDVYYCNFDLVAGQEITIELYYHVGLNEDNQPQYYLARELDVTINEDGWGHSEIVSGVDDPLRNYLLQYTDEEGFPLADIVFTLAAGG